MVMIDYIPYSTSHSIVCTKCILLVSKWDLMSSEMKFIQPYYNQLFPQVKPTIIIDSTTTFVPFSLI